MFGISYARWKWIIALLVLGNIVNYLYTNWGLVTVKVNDAPLRKVINSIEWQGWVKIYTNLPPDTKVTMYVDHVPLAEAMETLAANVDVPPPPPSPDGATGTRPNRDQSARPGDQPGGFAGAPPGGGGPFGGPGGGTGGAGAPGGPQGGRGGGFGGRGAQWNLAFFVAPTPAQVKQEIREFQSSDPNDDTKVYTYGTQMQLIATESMAITADPRLQSWPGVKPVDPSTGPAQAPPAAPVDAQANAATTPPTGNAPADPPANATPTLQTYLQAFAESANIWIMAPASWAPEVSSAPPPNASIIRAVENFVGGSHGAVTQALVLRAGRGGARGGNRGDVAGGDDAWADRMRNAITGLPPDERPDALDQLNKEVQFRKDLQAVPPEQRRQKMFQHMMEKMIYGERLSRLSPVKRAQVYQRMVTARAAAKAQK
jgi:hypothetical protein